LADTYLDKQSFPIFALLMLFPINTNIFRLTGNKMQTNSRTIKEDLSSRAEQGRNGKGMSASVQTKQANAKLVLLP
jgi:hypothetical protein